MKMIATAALIFSVLNAAHAAELCAKDSEGNWKTTKGIPCYMGNQQLGQPTGAAPVAPAISPNLTNMGPTVLGGGAAASQASAPVVALEAAVPVVPAIQFSVSRADKTIRETLVKWSKAAGWAFEPEHWVIDRDIPVGGSKELGTDYKAAVRTLVASTVLSDRAARPCFYNNNVLRVIPKTERCSPEQ